MCVRLSILILYTVRQLFYISVCVCVSVLTYPVYSKSVILYICMCVRLSLLILYTVSQLFYISVCASVHTYPVYSKSVILYIYMCVCAFIHPYLSYIQ